MPIYGNIPEDFYPRPSDINAPLRSTIGIGPRGPKGHSITAKVVDSDPYGYFRVQFIDADTSEVLVTTPNLDVGSRFFVCDKLFEDVNVGSRQSAVVTSFSSLQASSDRSSIRVGDLVFFTTRTSNETFLTLDTIGIGVVNSVNGTNVYFMATNIMIAQIRDGGITTDMLADLCVTTEKIVDEAITTAKLSDEAITTPKILDLNVTTNKLAQNSVTNEKITDGAINSTKIVDNAITEQKLDTTFLNKIQITRWRTTPETISVDNITQNLAFYANTSFVSDLPVNSNGWFINYCISSVDYRMQIFIANNQQVWVRTKGNEWHEWYKIPTSNQTILMQGTHVENIDDIRYNTGFWATQSNNQTLPTSGNGWLTVQNYGANSLQTFFDYVNGTISWRIYGSPGGTPGWFDWHTFTFSGEHYYQQGNIRQYNNYKYLSLTNDVHQDIAAYNNKLFAIITYDNNPRIRVFNLEENTYQNYQATFGHGNGAVFGSDKAPNSDYPYLYISGWNDNKVYVYSFVSDSFVLYRTIDLPVTGYTTCCVDDVRKKLYIFSIQQAPSSPTPYTFTIYNYENETIEYTTLTDPFATIQGIDLHDGVITVVSGLGTTQEPSLIRTYNTRGEKIGEYFGHPFNTLEPEGFTYDPVTGRTFTSTVQACYEII